ncbi:MAG TPA: carboxypeptidase-like regulatory domain-containing protein [Candidatus Limnocylindrales bacterium]|nr:carboxypeptidase-like regulatory domain-containing protein [Candidatus Limnocylindrales bacterium]
MPALAILAAALVSAACNPSPAQTAGPAATAGPVSPAASSGLGATPVGGGPAAPSTAAEANVIKGRAVTATGAPIAGASVRIVGYTGGSSLGQEIETVTTGADGTYRYEVPPGLYEVHAEGPLAFGGQTYLFDLAPADGTCDQQQSDQGIVKDYVLRLRGLMSCQDGGVNPDNYLFYHGAAVQLSTQLGTAGREDVVEFRFEPIGTLADGSPGAPLTMRRSVGAMSAYVGPIEETAYLHDIPLARYSVSATLLTADSRRVPLMLATDGPPSKSVEVSFEPRMVVGTLAVGYSSLMPTLTVQEGG